MIRQGKPASASLRARTAPLNPAPTTRILSNARPPPEFIVFIPVGVITNLAFAVEPAVTGRTGLSTLEAGGIACAAECVSHHAVAVHAISFRHHPCLQ